jgi:hypothetical protein
MKRETLLMTLFFAILFGVCYSATSWLATLHASLPTWNFAFEARVPFIPSFAILYLTIIPALLLAPLFFPTRDALTPLFFTLCVETVIACAFFLVIPLTSAFVRPPTHGWIGYVFRFADTLNLQSNQFPSLHVAFACTAAWAYGPRLRALRAAWCTAVSASAWLIWEHHLIDLAGGAVLAATCIVWIYLPLQDREKRRLFWTELWCLEQCARFSLRHRRYLVIFAAIWGPSILNWRALRVVRVAFCTAQWIDDVLDGDRSSRREPLEVVDEFLSQESWLFEELRKLDAEDKFIALVREMRRDRERVINNARWNAGEIDEHLRRTFHLSVELMLILTGSRGRANDVPALIDALAWCSTFRDLDEDLRKGLMNIPIEVDDVDAWARRRHLQAAAILHTSAAEVANLDDRRSREILGMFQRSIENFHKRYGRAQNSEPGNGRTTARRSPAHRPSGT